MMATLATLATLLLLMEPPAAFALCSRRPFDEVRYRRHDRGRRGAEPAESGQARMIEHCAVQDFARQRRMDHWPAITKCDMHEIAGGLEHVKAKRSHAALEPILS